MRIENNQNVLAQQFRHAVGIYDDIFVAVVGIIDYRFDRRLSYATVAQT